MTQAKYDTTDIDWYLSSIGFGCNPAAVKRAYLREYLSLHALSDEALLARGMRREMIAERVYSKVLTMAHPAQP